MNKQYENQLFKVLEREQLADLSQFHRPGFFDEVPLFSRASEIDFLPGGHDRTSAFLLRFALKFLNAVAAYEEHPRGFFAAITIWGPMADPLIPNLFVRCGDIPALKEKLALETPTTSFARRIKKLVGKLRSGESFEVREDRLTVPGATRVFIAPERLPHPGVVPLAAFSLEAKTAQRHKRGGKRLLKPSS